MDAFGSDAEDPVRAPHRRNVLYPEPGAVFRTDPGTAAFLDITLNLCLIKIISPSSCHSGGLRLGAGRPTMREAETEVIATHYLSSSTVRYFEPQPWLSDSVCLNQHSVPGSSIRDCLNRRTSRPRLQFGIPRLAEQDQLGEFLLAYFLWNMPVLFCFYR